MNRASLIGLSLALLPACAMFSGQPGFFESVDDQGQPSGYHSKLEAYEATDSLDALPAMEEAYYNALNAPPPQWNGRIYNGTLPAGMTRDEKTGQISADSSATMTPIARFRLHFYNRKDRRAYEPDLKRLAVLAKADAMYIELGPGKNGHISFRRVYGTFFQQK